MRAAVGLHYTRKRRNGGSLRVAKNANILVLSPVFAAPRGIRGRGETVCDGDFRGGGVVGVRRIRASLLKTFGLHEPPF